MKPCNIVSSTDQTALFCYRSNIDIAERERERERERNKCSSHFCLLQLYTASSLAVFVARKIFQLTSSLSSSQWNGSWKNRATGTRRKWLWDTATGTFKVSFSTAARRTAIVEAPCSFFLSASRRLCLLSAKLPRSFRL